MNISILTVFPELYSPFIETSLIKRASQNGIVDFDIRSFFSFVAPKERIDDSTFGPGAGMLIRPEVVQKGIESLDRDHGNSFKVFFSPQGQKLNQRILGTIAKAAQEREHILLVPARYEGMDARVEEHYADIVVSVGDFVLMGGDVPAMMLIEGLLRLIPGVVGKKESVEHESFTGPFVDYPEYTAPVEWSGKVVPDIVRSGNHEEIRKWRLSKAAHKSVYHHFDWLRTQPMTQEDQKIAAEFIPPHYIALMHSEVLIGKERDVGTTSVTSIDIHDIARSARTYGLDGYCIVTPLIDQQKIVQKFLDFWRSELGDEYNKNRQHALKYVNVSSTIDEAIEKIEKKEGKKPLIIATSARAMSHRKCITFHDQEKVWTLNRPVLFVLGTGKGMTEDFINRCDFLLSPIYGFSDFNHLSVRSAAAVIFDRWYGINPKEYPQVV